MPGLYAIVERHHADAPYQHFATARTVSVVARMARHVAHVNEVKAFGDCHIPRPRQRSNWSARDVLQAVARVKARKVNWHIRAQVLLHEASKLAGFLLAVIQARDQQGYDLKPNLPFGEQAQCVQHRRELSDALLFIEFLGHCLEINLHRAENSAKIVHRARLDEPVRYH